MHLDQFWGYQKTDLVVVFSKYLILLDPWVSKLDLIYYGYDISNRAYSAKDLNIKYLILLDPWLSKLDLIYYRYNISNQAYSPKNLNIKYLILLDSWLSKLDLKYYIHNAIDSNFISLAE